MQTTEDDRPLVTEEERQTLYTIMEHQQPEVWRRLCPRVYPEPPTSGEYYPAEDVGHFFFGRAIAPTRTWGWRTSP
jgi:hypothetical protein